MSVLLAVLMYALWSSVFAFGKMTLQYSPPIFLTAFRMLLAGALILGWLLLRNRASLKMTRKEFFSLVILAFLSIYVTNVLEFWGLQYLTAAKTCFIYSLSPFFAALFSYIHFREKMTSLKWVGMILGFAGCIPVLALQKGSEELLSAVSFLSWPEIAIIGAALCSIYGWVLLRVVVKNSNVSPLAANGVSMLLGGLMALIHSFISDSWNPTPIVVGHTKEFLQGTVMMTFISNIVCYNLYGLMLKRFTATFLSFLGLLSPIFASLSGWLFLGEQPSWLIFLSTSILSTGLWIVYRTELKQGYIAKENTSPKAVESSS